AEDRALVARLLQRGRAAPQVVVHRRRRLLRAVHLADAAPRLVAQAAGQRDLAELALVEEVHGRARAGHAAAVGAGLTDAVVPAGRLDDPPALADVVADRLLDVNVLAGLDGPDGHERVPVVRRGDADDVDALVVEQLAEVLLELGGVALRLLDG